MRNRTRVCNVSTGRYGESKASQRVMFVNTLKYVNAKDCIMDGITH